MEKVQNSSLMMEEMPPFYVFMVWTNKENMKKQGFSQNQSEVLNLKINYLFKTIYDCLKKDKNFFSKLTKDLKGVS